MSIQLLRIILAIIWILSFVVSVVLILAAPTIRGDEAIGFDRQLDVLTQVSGLWLPPLSCFVAFWFTEGGPSPSQVRADLEKVVGAIVLVSGYALIVLILLYMSLKTPFDHDAEGNLVGMSTAERIGAIVKYALLISSLFVLAPVGYCTGQKVQRHANP